jgi:hypothetical protein
LGTLENVKRPLTLVLGIVAMAAVVFLVYEYRGDLGLGGRGSGTKIDWETVNRSSDGFTVQLPAGVSATLVPVYTERRVVEQIEMIEAQVAPDTTYAVAWADNPPVERAASEDTEKTLNMARDGALGRTQTTLVMESRGKIGGYASREILARNARGGILNGRLILAGTHLYMLIGTFPSTSARRDEDVKRFFDSFSLTNSGVTMGAPRN